MEQRMKDDNREFVADIRNKLQSITTVLDLLEKDKIPPKKFIAQAKKDLAAVIKAVVSA